MSSICLNPCAYAYSFYIPGAMRFPHREDCLSSSIRFYPAPNHSNPLLTVCIQKVDAFLHHQSTHLPLQSLRAETSFTREPTTPIRNSSSLKLPHIPIRNRRPVDLGIRRVRPSLRSRPRALSISRHIKRQITAHPPSHILLPNSLSLLPARKVAFLAGHDLARMDDIEEHEGDEHECGVEYVLVCFVDWDAAAVAAGVFD